ncbi:N-glycosylase/DNA lyase [Candidatus Desantisbacteria bacterium]|nr:N-glycosylase/DNA lyase [Candidatus Desantisbacteria bacterium]
MDGNLNLVKDIQEIYYTKKEDVQKKLDDFKNLWKYGSDTEIFIELVFCLLTPQSKAKSSWSAVQRLIKKDLILNGSKNEISKELNIVRFRNKKAEYIVNARKVFTKKNKISIKYEIMQFNDNYKLREWIVKNVKGIGFKEASHFLRNIGKGENLAIIDRHILKNLKYADIIKKIPDSISIKNYLNMEIKMRKFAEKIKIPMEHLDLILWCKETGEIFK